MRLFLGCLSSSSGSMVLTESRLARVAALVPTGRLAADMGVAGGVENKRLPLLPAVTPGTVPINGVGEFPIIATVEDGCAKDPCVAMDETELERDFVGLAVGL